jgi:hypothetical protein
MASALNCPLRCNREAAPQLLAADAVLVGPWTIVAVVCLPSGRLPAGCSSSDTKAATTCSTCATPLVAWCTRESLGSSPAGQCLAAPVHPDFRHPRVGRGSAGHAGFANRPGIHAAGLPLAGPGASRLVGRSNGGGAARGRVQRQYDFRARGHGGFHGGRHAGLCDGR